MVSGFDDRREISCLVIRCNFIFLLDKVEVEGDTFTVQLDAEGKMKRYAIKRINWATYHEKRQQNIEVWPGKVGTMLTSTR